MRHERKRAKESSATWLKQPGSMFFQALGRAGPGSKLLTWASETQRDGETGTEKRKKARDGKTQQFGIARPMRNSSQGARALLFVNKKLCNNLKQKKTPKQTQTFSFVDHWFASHESGSLLCFVDVCHHKRSMFQVVDPFALIFGSIRILFNPFGTLTMRKYTTKDTMPSIDMLGENTTALVVDENSIKQS
jgi:hypothetical protein